MRLLLVALIRLYQLHAVAAAAAGLPLLSELLAVRARRRARARRVARRSGSRSRGSLAAIRGIRAASTSSAARGHRQKVSVPLHLLLATSWLDPIVNVLSQVVLTIDKPIQNLGWTLVILAALIRLFFWPLNTAQFKVDC